MSIFLPDADEHSDQKLSLKYKSELKMKWIFFLLKNHYPRIIIKNKEIIDLWFIIIFNLSIWQEEKMALLHLDNFQVNGCVKASHFP